MFRILIVMILMCLLVGCGTKQKPVPELTQEHVQQSSMTALESYVAMASAGSETFIVGTKYGDVNVSVRKQYYAASGKICRMVDVITKGKCVLELAVCREDDGTWKEVPVLWNRCAW